MGTPTSDRTRAAPERPLSRTRTWMRARAVLGVVGVVVVAATVLLGAHPSSPDRLRADVAAGGVGSVEVAGGLGPTGPGDAPTGDVAGDAEGWATQQVRWRSGLLLRQAEVASVAPGSPAGDVPDDLEVVRGDLVPGLRDLDPDLVVDRAAYPTSTWSLLGVDVPRWVGLAGAGLWFAALVVLVSGSEPWRLSRWGWFWVLLVAPGGIPLFLLLSGPPLPRPRRRRLGGGWGFVIALVLSVVLPGWVPG